MGLLEELYKPELNRLFEKHRNLLEQKKNYFSKGKKFNKDDNGYQNLFNAIDKVSVKINKIFNKPLN